MVQFDDFQSDDARAAAEIEADVGLEHIADVYAKALLDAAENGLSYGLRLPGATIRMRHGELHKHHCLAALASFGHG